MTFFRISFFLLLANLSFGQNINYAKRVIDTLCAAEMHGRGYVQNGTNKAADFIAGEFAKYALRDIATDYRQKFEVSVNTQPGKLELRIGKNKLIPGIDFLVHPASPTLSGKFKIYYISEEILLDEKALAKALLEAENKILGILPAAEEVPHSIQKEIQARLRKLYKAEDNATKGSLVFSDKKLTWHGATAVFSKPVFIVKANTEKHYKKTKFEIESLFIEKYPVENVLGFIQGNSDSVILISAHYDHLGRMGAETYFPGANDNASGTALMLDLARHYASMRNIPKYSFLFIAFAAEEIGLLGSEFYCEKPLLPLDKIKFQINLDLCGTGEKGVQVVNGTLHPKQFELLSKINGEQKYLEQVKIRGESCNSDHCPFHKKGVPAFFIYTLGGSAAYHDIHDKPEQLSLYGYAPFYRLLVDFIAKL